MAAVRGSRKAAFGQWVGYRLYQLMAWIARVPPRRISVRAYRWGTRLAHAVATGARATVAANYAHVLGLPPGSPEVRAAVKEGFSRYGRYWFDTFRMLDEPDHRFIARIPIEGIGYLDAALAEGRGAILALPHAGNWDAAGHAIAIMGYRPLAVVESLEPPELLDLFIEHRAALGIRTLPIVKGKGIGDALRDELGANGVIALVSDRDLSGRGIEVSMFGAVRRMPAGPAALALSTGAALLPCSARQIKGGWRAWIEPPLTVDPSGSQRQDVAALTEALAARFELMIAADPTDWHMFQPAWP